MPLLNNKVPQSIVNYLGLLMIGSEHFRKRSRADKVVNYI